jgi:hypothetical protein
MKAKQSNKKSGDSKQPLSVRINGEVRHSLKVKAALERRTAGSIVEDLIRKYLAEKSPAKG